MKLIGSSNISQLLITYNRYHKDKKYLLQWNSNNNNNNDNNNNNIQVLLP